MQVSNLFVYLIYSLFSLIIFFIDSYFGLLSIVFSYFLLFVLNFKKTGSIFNYVQFYLLSCWILTINQIFNLYLFDQNLKNLNSKFAHIVYHFFEKVRV